MHNIIKVPIFAGNSTDNKRKCTFNNTVFLKMLSVNWAIILLRLIRMMELNQP
jgi:hypothetical protein